MSKMNKQEKNEQHRQRMKVRREKYHANQGDTSVMRALADGAKIRLNFSDHPEGVRRTERFENYQ